MDNRLSFHHMLQVVKKLLVMNALFWAFMSLFRLVFFFYFSEGTDFRGLYGYLAQAFILGARFDLSAIAYINTLVTLSLLIVGAIGRRSVFDAWAWALKYYYTLTYGIVVVILIVDFGFYSYFKNHINVLIYGFFEDDTLALVKTIAQNPRFPVAAVILVAAMVLVYVISSRTSGSLRRSEPALPRRFPVWMKTVLIALLVCGNGLAARGTLRMFPLSPIYAEISPDPFINKLSVNGIFALGDALKARSENRNSAVSLLKQFGYEKDATLAFADYLNVPAGRLNRADLIANLARRTPKNPAAERLRPNVVVIVMESFGSNLLKYDSKEFDLLGQLRPHFESDYVFHNFLPAGLITIHALETIILNIPQRPYNLSVTQSKYAFVPFPTRSTLPFKNAGYRTTFLYGGSLGWRQLASFLPAQGFDDVLGEGYMPADAGKNEWGVYDEFLFDALYRNLSSGGTAPKFILVMTTGNHPPYSVPASYKPLSLNIPPALAKVMASDRTLAMKRFITYQYANEKLGEFITKVKASPLGKNTIIAVTGDHNFWDVFSYGSEDLFYRYGVPFYLYVPGELRPRAVDTAVCGSHSDIMPTLYHLALSDREYLAVGKDLLGKDARQAGMNSEGLVISPDGAVYRRFDTGTDEYYGWDGKETGKLVSAVRSSALEALRTSANAACAISEYIITGADRSNADGNK